MDGRIFQTPVADVGRQHIVLKNILFSIKILYSTRIFSVFNMNDRMSPAPSAETDCRHTQMSLASSAKTDCHRTLVEYSTYSTRIF